MTKTNQRWQKWLRLPLTAAVAAGISAPAGAFTFTYGDLEGSFDTSLSAGMTWRVQNQSKDLIAQGNLGLDQNGNPIFANTNTGASSNNSDDGNLNFERGDAVSKIIKGTSELLLNYPVYGDYLTRVGGFTRAKYFYDFVIKDESMATDPSGQQRELNDQVTDDGAGGDLLDAYVYSDWFVGGMPVSLRYGRQVLSWGESTFIQGGVNVINPFDIPALRAPGAELKEGFLPVEMLYGSVGLTNRLTVEAFWQVKWEETQIEDCGTFFSTNDFVGDGCGPVLLAAQLPDFEVLNQGLVSPREGDRRPDDDGQFGVALRFYSPELNDTEFGLYYMNLHSRLPLVSGRAANPGGINASQPPSSLPSYFVEYPEDIDIFGFSFNSNLPGGWAFSGEYTFRPNQPVQINAFELINAGVLNPFSKLFQDQQRQVGEELGLGGPAPINQTVANVAGEAVDGFKRLEVSQAQLTFLQFYEQVMGASRLTVIAEIGGNFVHALPSKNQMRFGRSNIFGQANFGTGLNNVDASGNPTSCAAENVNDSNCDIDAFVTDFSWGYVTRFTWAYDNVFAGINLTPQVAFRHGVQGYGPEPGAAFREGEKTLGLSVSADYLETYTASVGYTNFFGGDYNVRRDRDFVSASIGYSF